MTVTLTVPFRGTEQCGVQVLMHLYTIMDAITHRKYMLVYIHTDIASVYRPDRWQFT